MSNISKKKILKFMELDFFLNKPVNPQVHRFLINKMLYELYDKVSLFPVDLVNTVYAENFEHQKPEWLIDGTYYPFARSFKLVKRDDQKRILLTKNGRVYVEKDKNRPEDMSDIQTKYICDLMISNPVETNIINGIYNFVELVFELMKNGRDIPANELIEHFIFKSGKIFEWTKIKTKIQQFNTYKNICIDLRLIQTEDNLMSLTWRGIKFYYRINLNRTRKVLNI